MLVRELMEREVTTLEVGDRLDLAQDIMQLGRIRHLPVVSRGRLVGILSHRDLLRAGLSSLLQLPRREEREWLATVAVNAVMTTNVFTVAPDATVRSAVETMLHKKIGCLPVVEDGTLVGLLSETDCLRHLIHVFDIAETKARLAPLPDGA
jgi:CBS domain-containing membrane protein